MKKLTQEEFLNKCKKVHGDKYDYSLVNYTNTRENIKIICTEHGIFEQNAKNHKGGQGCKICSGKYKRTTNDFIKESKKIYNDKYDYSLVEYKDRNTKVKLIDLEKNITIEQIPYHHLGGRVTVKLNKDIFIERAKKIHGDKYDYSFVEYKNINSKIKIKCNEYGFIFEQSPRSHLSGHGYGNITKEIFIKKCMKLHDNIYDYSLVTEINSNKEKVKVICSEHGTFEQGVSNHMNNEQGCPECKVMSKGESKIAKLLKGQYVNYIKEHKFENCIYDGQKLRFDFYLPNHNICIEYDGRQHYEPIKYFGGDESFKLRKIRDNFKNKYCEENNIYLIRIPYYDFNNIDKIINKKLN